MNPFTERVSNLLPNQVHKKAIEVDAHLRVKGAPLGEIYAIGDCATVGLSEVLIALCEKLIWLAH
jgi:NADH dehydrogenase